jgi:hypothetical protein
MQERAIVYFVVAWLACWFVDLLFIVLRAPASADPVLKLIIVACCLFIVVFTLARAGWMYP